LSNELYWEILEEAFPTASYWKDWQIDVDLLIQLTKLMPKSKILDIGFCKKVLSSFWMG